MAKLILGFAAMCSAWIRTTVAVLREVRYDPQVGQPGGEGGSLPQGGGGIDEPTEWERLKPKFTPEQTGELMGNTSGRDNMCIDGRLAPELIVIGAMIAATNSFNTALAYSPGLVFPEIHYDRNDKKQTKYLQGGGGEQDGQPAGGRDLATEEEDPSRPKGWDGWKNGQGHFFDVMYFLGRDWMSKAYPECTTSERRVAVDSTARYAQDPKVPGNIASWYGVTNGPRLRFVFILRDPLVRLHEHFWKAKEGRWCGRLSMNGFGCFVRYLLAGFGNLYVPSNVTVSGDGRCEEILGASLYTSQIKSWFWTFDPSQFTFIPFRYVVEGSSTRNAPVEHVWEQLGVRGLIPPRVHANVLPISHPTLDEEVPRQTQNQFWTRYRSLMGPREVSELVAGTNATLYGFEGERSVSEVTNWLVSNW